MKTRAPDTFRRCGISIVISALLLSACATTEGSDDSDSDVSGLSIFAAVLAGVAQGAAASRGAAVPTYQPSPRTYTPSPAPSVAQSPYTASTTTRSTPAPVSTPSGASSSAPKKVARMANECLKVKEDSVGMDMAIMLNSCSEKINYLFCVDSSNGGGHFSCRKQNFGSSDIRAHGSDTFSVMSANKPMRIHWFACTEGDGLLVSRTVRFDSGGMRGTCR